MSLSVLVLLVTSGIAGIAILLHVLGFSTPRRFEDEQSVRDVWLDEYPGTSVQKVHASRNKHYALVETDAGLGIVWPMGIDGAARLLLGVTVDPSANGLTLNLPDYTAPEITLHLEPDEAHSWQNRIERQF